MPENIPATKILGNNPALAAALYEDHEIEHQTPRMGSIITTSFLQKCSNLPKNERFQNYFQHKCNLYSASPSLIAQNLFDISHTANYIHKPDGSKETIGSLINGDNKTIWLRSLRNNWGRLAQGNDARKKAQTPCSSCAETRSHLIKKSHGPPLYAIISPLKQNNALLMSQLAVINFLMNPQ